MMERVYDVNFKKLSEKNYGIDNGNAKKNMSELKNDYMTLGDIPDAAYMDIEDLKGNDTEQFITINVTEKGITVVECLIKDDKELYLVPGSTSIKLFNAMLPSGIFKKQMRIAAPKPGKLYLFEESENMSLDDFREKGLYTYIYDSVTDCFEIGTKSFELYILRDNVIMVEGKGVICNNITFRKSSDFENTYDIIVDVNENDKEEWDITIPYDELKKGYKFPLLSDALKNQCSFVFAGWKSGKYFRRTIFLNKEDNIYQDTGRLNSISSHIYNLDLMTKNSEIYYELIDVKVLDNKITMIWEEPNGHSSSFEIVKEDDIWSIKPYNLIDETPIENVLPYLFEEFVKNKLIEK